MAVIFLAHAGNKTIVQQKVEAVVCAAPGVRRDRAIRKGSRADSVSRLTFFCYCLISNIFANLPAAFVRLPPLLTIPLILHFGC